MYEVEGQVSIFDLDTESTKMSPEPSVPTKARTSASSSRNSPKSQTKMPLFLCLKAENGQRADASWETGGAYLGEFSMHSFGESPNVDVESHLSQILEANPHPKYCLSAKACQGILNRANRRGKKLPPMLQEALEQMIERERNQTPLTDAEKLKMTKAAYEIGKMAEEGMIGAYPSEEEEWEADERLLRQMAREDAEEE